MAYNPLEFPDPVKDTGALSTEDIFRYFKEALLFQPLGIEEDIEGWPRYLSDTLYSVIKFFGDNGWVSGSVSSDTNMPITRGQFYSYVEEYTTGSGALSVNGVHNDGPYRDFFSHYMGAPLYDYAQVTNSWPPNAVRAWGKIKCCELALFGSVGNGGGLTDESIIKTGNLRGSVADWEIFDQTYLRAAMINLNFSPGCFTGSGNPMPTGLSINASARTINWNNAPGFPNTSDYLFSLRGSDFNPVSSKPINFGGAPLIPGDFAIITKGSGYLDDSEPLINDSDVPPSAYNMSLFLPTPVPSITETIWLYSEYPVPIPMLVTGMVMYNVPGGQRQAPFAILLNQGGDEAFSEVVYESMPIDDHRVLINVEYPLNLGGVPVILIY